MIGLRNDHDYSGEPWEHKRLRKRAEADERHAVDSHDLPGDREAEHAPVQWWAIDPSFHSLRPPGILTHGRVAQEPVAPSSDPLPEVGAAEPHSAAGDGTGECPSLAAHPSRKAA